MDLISVLANPMSPLGHSSVMKMRPIEDKVVKERKWDGSVKLSGKFMEISQRKEQGRRDRPRKTWGEVNNMIPIRENWRFLPPYAPCRVYRIWTTNISKLATRNSFVKLFPTPKMCSIFHEKEFQCWHVTAKPCYNTNMRVHLRTKETLTLKLRYLKMVIMERCC